jgi:hypothetical protein
LKIARKEANAERIAFFEREIKRESDWDTHNPLKEHTYVCTEALTAMMDVLDAHGLNARLVFWFDN